MKILTNSLSPCGIVCNECPRFPKTCDGCRAISGKPWWLKYMQLSECAVYQCCRQTGKITCAGCKSLPCERFTKDPTISDEENAAHLLAMLENLSRIG